MVVAITGADRKVIAVQRTFLRVEGRGKANVSQQKLSLGPMRDGAVRLGPAGLVLGIAEGVESGLSAMQLFDLPVWCSLSASRLDRLWLPPESLEVHIFGDNGTAGHEAAERAAQAYLAQGWRVVVRFPPERFGDFNDLLSAEAAAEKVKQAGVPFRFQPTSSRERRIIHLALRDDPEVKSLSEGVAPRRHTVVYAVDPKERR